jgi:hypothetical protein
LVFEKILAGKRFDKILNQFLNEHLNLIERCEGAEMVRARVIDDGDIITSRGAASG